MTARPGLRERKNARTREAIERAAYELTLEQGYDRTTVTEIAERADVAPRTVFTRYATKEAIIFGVRSDASAARLTEAITGDAGGLVDRLAQFIRDSIEAQQSALELEKLRTRAILSDPFLRRTLRGQLEAAEHTVAQHLAAELGVPATSAGVRVFAAAVTGLFMAMLDSCTQDPEHHDSLAITEAGLPVLRAALEAVRNNA